VTFFPLVITLLVPGCKEVPASAFIGLIKPIKIIPKIDNKIINDFFIKRSLN
jgi:hypothetical protein